jgi:hypothetical protein
MGVNLMNTLEKNDQEFEKNLIEKLEDFIPEERALKSVNPFSKPISYIVWGLIISSIQLDLLHLQYLLPNIGIVLILVGYRSIKNENKWFYRAWLLTIVTLVVLLLLYICLASPWLNDFEVGSYSFMGMLFSIVFLCYRVAIFLIFRQAILTVYGNCGLKQPRDYLLLSTICIGLIGLMAFLPVNVSDMLVWMTSTLMIALFLVIVKTLFLVKDNLGIVGYSIINASIRFGSRTVILSYIMITCILVGLVCYSTNHLKLEAKEYIFPTPPSYTILAEKGVPTNILQDLSAYNLVLLKDTVKVYVTEEKMNFDMNLYIIGTEAQKALESKKYSKANMQVTTIFLLQSDESVYVIEYFEWLKGGAYWNDGFVIYGQDNMELINGRLLYRLNNIDYFADIPRLKQGQVKIYDFSHEIINIGITGGVSYPFNSQSQRGFILYKSKPQSVDKASSELSYLHFKTPFRLPNGFPEQMMYSGSGTKLIHYSNIDPSIK